tara:strand:- start:63 stop:431 length:369 start_codon:yes stop_codon:yes gene_type:complete
MKTLKFFSIIIIFLNCVMLNFAKSDDKLKNKISKNIRCLICQGQSVYDSESDFAISMKLVIEKKINEGFSESEIYNFLKDQYGQWIIYDPEFNKKTFILWLLPILLFLIGGALIFRKFIVQK